MNLQYSVLIYSKYSNSCKNIFEIIKQSGIDFDKTNLRLLCIDNEKIRKRIKDNKQIDIVAVPCILSIFSTGAVEKYDGENAFSWIFNFIQNTAPKIPSEKQRSPQISPQISPQTSPQTSPQQTASVEYTEPLTQKQPEVPEKQMNKVVQKQKKVHFQESAQPTSTSIDNIPFEEEADPNISDRHLTRPPPKRIRENNNNNFIEDPEFFKEEEDREYRKENSKSIKSSDKKVSDIRSKADILAKERDQITDELNSKKKIHVRGDMN